MSPFTTIRPETDAERDGALVVNVFQEPQSAGWIAVCDEIPIATEADSIEALIDRAWLIAPQIAELNGLPAGPELRLSFVVNTRAAA